MYKEIGSNFWVAPNDQITLRDVQLKRPSTVFGTSDYVWLSTCRSGIRIALELDEKNSKAEKVALLPAYTCDTVLQPFRDLGYTLTYYDVDMYLHIDGVELIKRLEETKARVFLFHHYFGFETISSIEEVVTYAREHKITTIEDCTQSMYSLFPKSESDYQVGSIRKWCGVLDGAYLAAKDQPINHKPTSYDRELESAMLRASLDKYRYIAEDEGEKGTFLSEYRVAKSILDSRGTTPYAISPISASVQCQLDRRLLEQSRRNNYRYLLSADCWTENCRPIFDELPPDVTPLYFPLWVSDRTSLQRFLADHSIYAPIIWPKPRICPPFGESTDNLYDHMLCIPIDQRYGDEEMNYISATLNAYEH